MLSQKYLKLALVAAALFVCGAVADVEGRQGRYQPRTERGIAAGQIVRKWAGYVQTVYRTPPMAWAKSMQATFAQADVRNLQRAAKMETYEGMMGVILGQKTSDANVIDRLARARTSSLQALAAGSPAEDLVYTMLSPCRIMDTRNTGSRIASGETRHINVSGQGFGYQGGQSCDSAIPADPSAVVINVVAVSPGADGFLSVYPYGTVRGASSLNYVRSSIVANELVAKATVGQPYDISIFSQADVDLVVDIVGYFMAPKASVPDCELQTSSEKMYPGTSGYKSTSCSFGVATGGACSVNLTHPSVRVQSQGFTLTSPGDGAEKTSGYGCHYSNESESIYTLTAQAVCCRLPGR